MGKYQLFKSSGKYWWNLKAGNGEKILSSEGYSAKSGAQHGIASCQRNSASDARYQRKEGSGPQPHYFVLKAENGETIGRSEMYSTAQAREKGIESCKTNGPGSPTQDETGE